MNRILCTMIIAALALIPAVCSAQTAGRMVRVRILPDSPSVVIAVQGDYSIENSDTAQVISSGKNLRARFTGSRNAIIFAGQNFSAARMSIRSGDSQVFEVNGRKYKGSLMLARKASGLLSVVNRIDLEDYVKGISVRETSHYWPMEALEAEAIAFRTFAVYRAQQGKDNDFDVSDDVFSQVYGGVAAERYRITDAVNKTKGMALFYKDEILPAFYHSTCGGHTENASLVWNISSPALEGVVCGFCKDSPHHSWKAVVPKERLRELLAKQGKRLGKISEVVIAGRDASGRVTNLDIVTAEKDIELSAKDFRSLIGVDTIKSTDFRVTAVKDTLVFDGVGWGHGVGLCQWGAYFMAKNGSTFRQILEHYYPGAELKDLDG